MTAYDNAKFIVERNAYAQAKHDADTTPFYRILEILNDAGSMAETMMILETWKQGDNTRGIFTQLDQSDYEKLTAEERRTLINRWCMLYQRYVYDLLRRRLD